MLLTQDRGGPAAGARRELARGRGSGVLTVLDRFRPAPAPLTRFHVQRHLDD
ncbi:hypothetical protein [Geodermatophilus sp. URMC 62]|uniref:hypothetical protein n=1 Tax=Geodermatophilus sp. URMC 62 TaxID=3423414 RepID=UPI00406D31AE